MSKVYLGIKREKRLGFFSVNRDSLFINGCNCRVAL